MGLNYFIDYTKAICKQCGIHPRWSRGGIDSDYCHCNCGEGVYGGWGLEDCPKNWKFSLWIKLMCRIFNRREYGRRKGT